MKTYALRQINYLIFLMFVFILISCKQDSMQMNENKDSLYIGEFGTCCNELKAAMDTSIVPNSFFRVEENNVLYQTIGYVNTETGAGYFDQAVIYCPFCGKKLQDKDEIRKKAQ